MGIIIINRGRGASKRAAQAYSIFTEAGFKSQYYLDGANFSFIVFDALMQSTAKIIHSNKTLVAGYIGTPVPIKENLDLAINKFIDDPHSQVQLRDLFIGHYLFFIYRSGTIYLYQDPIGAMKLYYDFQFETVASSFIGVTASKLELNFDVEGVYQYIWNGCTFGRKTVSKDIFQDCYSHYIISEQSVKRVGKSTYQIEKRGRYFEYEEEAIDFYEQQLIWLFGLYKSAFGNNVHLALSGGLDSRLAFATMKRVGIRPTLFVQGGQETADVRIASKLAAGEGFEIDQIDKEKLVAARVAELSWLVAFDGYDDHGTWERAVDYEDRLDRARSGAVYLNASLGEVYRNFFYLNDRRWTVGDVVDAFFSQYSWEFYKSEWRSSYRDCMIKSIQEVLNKKTEMLERWELELIYPLFRGRFWTSRDLENNLKFGRCLYPFLELDAIRDCCWIPIKWKNYHKFERKLIERMDKEIAYYPTTYSGRRDGTRISGRAFMELTLAYYRPVWTRELSRALKVQVRSKGCSVPSVAFNQEVLNVVGETLGGDELAVRRLKGLDMLASAVDGWR